MRRRLPPTPTGSVSGSSDVCRSNRAGEAAGAASSAEPEKGSANSVDGERRVGHRIAMSEIELAPLSHRLDDDEIKLLGKRLKDLGVTEFERGDDSMGHTIAARISEEALTEFLDRLDAHDLGAEIYLPIEFDGRVTVSDYRIASAQALADVLEEMKEELGVDEKDEYEGEEDEEEGAAKGKDEEDEEEGTVIEAQLRTIWQLVSDGVVEAIEKKLPLHLQV
jgi:hypothetical protein